MKKTGAWLLRYALEQLQITFTYGIPGVHNTEIYDELASSKQITPILVTHEGNGAFMADAYSRTTGKVGVLVIVPGAGVTQAASGIAEAYLDGIPILVISGGIRSQGEFHYQLHDIRQHELLAPITKATFHIQNHAEIIETLYKAHDIATTGEPGPVFIEIPVDIQLETGVVEKISNYQPLSPAPLTNDTLKSINTAAAMLVEAKQPGIFVGWGAVDAVSTVQSIAEYLSAPVATTLQGLSSFPANHSLHTGMGFGPAAVPAAEEAFNQCDCLLAVGTQFAEIATGSYGLPVPDKLIHVDINPQVFNKNYQAAVAIEGDAGQVLAELLVELEKLSTPRNYTELAGNIQDNKQRYLTEWLAHYSNERVNPAALFRELRTLVDNDTFIIADDGNHTFLTAELMPIYEGRHFISPTDFNCMGYAVPAAIAAKLAHPEQMIVAVVGDGALLMSGMELTTAAKYQLGIICLIFNDGELAQIAQAQQIPYNRKTCTQLGAIQFAALAVATGCEYIQIKGEDVIAEKLQQALALASENKPVVVDIAIDYSKRTRFTDGVVTTNLKRFPLKTQLKMVSRAIYRKLTG
ncbi:thiamine pyrophosphate-binding protein [Endozoicomonas sp. SM1973]|uniref:Thiamine pyrophosphate-binding protein n=1 Tax=Spartinivicinus marinus TaxID=2994442 RepID=A0A853IF42_9GAMM|nr:thiamine pyrophosphate-binding protein [Spartinivicinus marinus]MCX4027122.1 thiamine pyrophosphate-binding protein [Spartinivicinus marinus]NYZ68601.1 thiamine pyrophosphate-binding protein [Spartinivicinus marinus]